MERRKLKIISDGTAPGTRVLAMDPNDPESGDLLEGVQKVTWTVEVPPGDEQIATVTLVVRRVPVEAVGKEAESENEVDEPETA